MPIGVQHTNHKSFSIPYLPEYGVVSCRQPCKIERNSSSKLSKLPICNPSCIAVNSPFPRVKASPAGGRRELRIYYILPVRAESCGEKTAAQQTPTGKSSSSLPDSSADTGMCFILISHNCRATFAKRYSIRRRYFAPGLVSRNCDLPVIFCDTYEVFAIPPWKPGVKSLDYMNR